MKKIIFIFIAVFLLAIAKANALTISPPIFDLQALPGETVTGQVVLFNETENNLPLILSVESFEPKNLQAVFNSRPSLESQKDFLTWINLEKSSLFLRPGQKEVIPFTVRVPASAEVGNYYGALVWQSTTELNESGSSLGIAARVANLLFFTVAGDLKKSGEIQEFSTIKNKRFYTHLPISFQASIKNTGNVYLKPQGEIVVSNLFGRNSAQIIFNPGGNRILPGQERIYYSDWDRSAVSVAGFLLDFWPGLRKEITNFAFGRYRIRLNISDIEPPPVLSFWVAPLRLLFVFSIIVAILFVLKIFIKRRFNKTTK